MNNSEIKATFVAMCNGTQDKKTVNGRNNLSIHVVGDLLALYSYSTPIAVYDNKKVVLNCSFFSASTAKHQSGIRGFNCPVAYVYNFTSWNGTESALLKQAAPLYSYRKSELIAANGRKYTRFILLKQTPETVKISGCGETELHRYISEQAAKDEATRLNLLAYSWSVQ